MSHLTSGDFLDEPEYAECKCRGCKDRSAECRSSCESWKAYERYHEWERQQKSKRKLTMDVVYGYNPKKTNKMNGAYRNK